MDICDCTLGVAFKLVERDDPEVFKRVDIPFPLEVSVHQSEAAERAFVESDLRI